MRIQETDKVLKEARVRRKAPPKPRGFFTRLWHSLTSLFR